eukprot:766140-Hanusia_phi.AAC.2
MTGSAEHRSWLALGRHGLGQAARPGSRRPGDIIVLAATVALLPGKPSSLWASLPGSSATVAASTMLARQQGPARRRPAQYPAGR